MPRGFSESESEFYRDKLLEVGEELFSKNGLSGVSIDRIVKDVGIAKGSFYKFFKNKEDLCFDCLMRLEKRVRVGIKEDLGELKSTPGILMQQLIISLPKIIDKHPLISIFQNKKDLETLMLRVDPKKQQENFNGDSLFLGSILDGTGILDVVDGDVVTGFIWGLIFLTLNKDDLNGQLEPVVKLIADMAENYFKGRIK